MVMGKNNINKKMLNEFFSNNKHEIPDNGFTQRVKQQIPLQESSYDWIIHLFSTIGSISLIIYLDISEAILHYSNSLFVYFMNFFSKSSQLHFDWHNVSIMNEQLLTISIIILSTVAIGSFLYYTQYERN